jgi:Holliday junction resolvase RusA-like endonuclease
LEATVTILIQARAGGRPRTKGSLKVYCVRDRKHTIHLEEEVAESKKWRVAVARAVREAQLATHGKLLEYPGPVEVRLVFFFPRQEAVAGGPVPSHATEWPTHITLGDADKLARNVLDALSAPTKKAQIPLTSALIVDDSQVVSLSVAKFWSTPDREPGVQILVMDVDPPEPTLEVEGEIWRSALEFREGPYPVEAGS